MNRHDRKVLVGTTYGHAMADADGQRPEQVYVYLIDDQSRPIRIDGRAGYHDGMTLDLTKDQARELRELLLKALDEPEPSLSLEPDELCPIYDAKRRLAELRAEAGPRTDARITRSGVISAALSVLLADLAPDGYAMKDADQELAEENLDQATQEHVVALGEES